MRKICISLAILWLGACNDAAEQARTRAPLVVGSWSSLATVDPHQASSQLDIMVAQGLFLGLVKFDANGQIVPGVAQSWAVSPDGKSYIFRLRKAKWSNGAAITSETFAASLRRLFAPATASPWAKYLTDIENGDDVQAGRKPVSTLGVAALNPEVLEIRLAHPQPALLALLASPAGAPIPENMAKAERGGRFKPADFLTNGPYKIDGSTPTQTRLVPDYDYILPGVEKRLALDLRVQSDPAQALSAFLGGDLQILDARALPVDIMQSKGKLRDQLISPPANSLIGLAFNAQTKVLKRETVRRAISLLINRTALQKILEPVVRASPAYGLLPAAAPEYGPPAEPEWAAWTLQARHEEAKRLLIEAGISAAKPLKLGFLLDTSDQSQLVAAWMVEYLKPFNIRLTLEPALNPAQFKAHYLAGRYEIALTRWTELIDSPEAPLRDFGCGTGSQPNFLACDVLATAALNEARGVADLAQRTLKFRQAERLILQTTPIAPLFVTGSATLVSSDIVGWPVAGRAPVGIDRLSHKLRGLQ